MKRICLIGVLVIASLLVACEPLGKKRCFATYEDGSEREVECER